MSLSQHPAASTQHPVLTHQERVRRVYVTFVVACRSLLVDGFSLIELVISMAILSVGLVGAMRVFPLGLRASQRAESSSRAAIVAQRTIESLKLKSWDDLTGETTVEEDGFTVITRISQPTISHLVDPTRLKAIEVIVRSTLDGRSRELAFTTYLRHEGS